MKSNRPDGMLGVPFRSGASPERVRRFALLNSRSTQTLPTSSTSLITQAKVDAHTQFAGPRPGPDTETAGRRAASVLVLALWALFFLASLTVAIGAYVSAGLNAAARLDSRQRAREQAAAGVWRAWHEILSATNEAQAADNPAVFRDNAEMPGGSFTVFHLAVDKEGSVVTNYGVIRENRRLNLNEARESELAALARDRGGLTQASASEVASAVVAARSGNSGLTSAAGNDYDKKSGYVVRNRRYQLPEELLLISEVRETDGLFAAIGPFVTVHGKGFYSGTSVGRYGKDMSECRVRFVISAAGAGVYWYEE